MRACRRRRHLLSRTLYIINVYRLNFNKLSRNFVEAIRTTTSNCRVNFINLYSAFAINFSIVFLPHTNTVILLEPYSGTITEPGYLWPFLFSHRRYKIFMLFFKQKMSSLSFISRSVCRLLTHFLCLSLSLYSNITIIL